jgi:hypothetical protein
LDSKLQSHMLSIKLVSPAPYKPNEKVISKARHIMKSSYMLKKIKKKAAIVYTYKIIITVVK